MRTDRSVRILLLAELVEIRGTREISGLVFADLVADFGRDPFISFGFFLEL